MEVPQTTCGCFRKGPFAHGINYEATGRKEWKIHDTFQEGVL
jgi:hypothetical protein